MRLLKYIFYIISSLVLISGSTGCSYVSDTVEGLITDRASFSITAEYNEGNVIIRWDETDYSENFAGYEIYVTSKPNDEYASYELVASRNKNNVNLEYSSTDSYSYTLTGITTPTSSSHGVYFYRVGIIHWDEDEDDRTLDNGYWPEYPDPGWDGTSNYNDHSDLDAISGYARVVIP